MNPYQQFCKPALYSALQTMGLDYRYHRAEGTQLFYFDAGTGQERAVLDLLGGYGAVLLGHHQPELTRGAIGALNEGCPLHSQFSVRSAPALLAARLNDILREQTASPDDFLFSFCSTGAEAVEIAVKHAELARSQATEEQLREIRFRLSELRRLQVNLTLPAEFRHALQLPATGDAIDALQLTAAIEQFNQQQLQHKPGFVALKRSFHGKLSGSVQLTHGPGYSGPYRHLGLDVHFCDAQDIAGFAGTLPQSQLIGLKQQGGQFSLQWLELRRISAIFVEPVQGEGGIHSLSAAQAQQLKQLSLQLGCPLIADEIQCGSGRCGSFLAGSQMGLQPDYVILSKALGGGLVKIGLVAIKTSVYVTGYDLVQSSTFGEDEYSATVALHYLDLLYRDNASTLAQIKTLGQQLLQRLQQLQQQFPDVIADVRGHGLLLGVELHSQLNASSAMLRSMAYQDSLGYMATGFLLNQYAVRVAPSASAPAVIRLEPNLCLTAEHIEQVAQAFSGLCQTLRYQDAAFFLRFLLPAADAGRLGHSPAHLRPSIPESLAETAVGTDAPVAASAKVAFINHLISADWLAQIDPSMQRLSDAGCEQLLDKLDFDWRVAPLPARRFHSANGDSVDFVMYPLGLTSERIARLLANNDLQRLRQAIDERVQQAQQDGCTVAGLGMFTSVVTHNGKSVRATDIALTTGNALTVAMSVAAVRQAVPAAQLADMSIAVIGAAGNIGRVYASALSGHCRQLRLIGSGRAGSEKRLQQSACFIYQHCFDLLAQQPAAPAGGLLQTLWAQPQIRQWLQQPHTAPADIGQAIGNLFAGQADAPVLLSDDISRVRGAGVVICATNAAEAFLPVDLLDPACVVCDVSVPHNLDQQTLDSRPDLVCIRGGLVATPRGESLAANVRAYLEPGQIYACMAETILMGLAQIRDHFSYGDLSNAQVSQMAALAQQHGFVLAQAKTSQSM